MVAGPAEVVNSQRGHAIRQRYRPAEATAIDDELHGPRRCIGAGGSRCGGEDDVARRRRCRRASSICKLTVVG